MQNKALHCISVHVVCNNFFEFLIFFLQKYLCSSISLTSTDSGGARPTLMPPSARLTSPRPFVPNNAPPKLPGSSSFPRSSNPEPPRNKFPPPSQPKSSRPDIGSRSDAGPPPVPSAPRPSLSSTPSRGPPPFPGNRPLNTGPSLPNRNQGSSHHFSPTPPHSNTNRSHPTHSSGRVVEDKPSPSTLPTHNTNRPPLPPTPARMMDDRPPPPPMMNRPMNRDGPPPPPPQHHKPPVPQTPRPTPSFQAPPPPPPNRPGPPQSHHGASTDAEIPRLPQRNMSLHGTPSLSPGTVRSGPLPPSERPPPPVRDPPSRSGMLTKHYKMPMGCKVPWERLGQLRSQVTCAGSKPDLTK